MCDVSKTVRSFEYSKTIIKISCSTAAKVVSKRLRKTQPKSIIVGSCSELQFRELVSMFSLINTK